MTPQEGIANARQAARNLLKRFGVVTLQHVDVEAFAARLGVSIVNARLRGAFAQLVVNAFRARILISRRVTNPAVRRAAIAHELAHYVLRHPTPPVAEMCSPRPQVPCSDVRDFENEANAFALELLTPTRAVAEVCDVAPMTLTAAGQLSMSCWVPVEAAAIRITERSDRMCAAVYCVDGRIAWVSPSGPFIHELANFVGPALTPGYPLDPRSMASRVTRGELCVPGLVTAGAWLADARIEEPELTEHAIPVGDDGAVLVMLWAGLHEFWRAQRSHAIAG